MATKVQNQRLLNVARALREYPEPKGFTMQYFVQDCGTPACALGHYVFRRDLQRVFKFVSYIGKRWDPVTQGWKPCVKYDIARVTDAHDRKSSLSYDVSVLEHFGITELESEELFGYYGCGEARTAKRAAAYIERFVAKRQRA